MKWVFIVLIISILSANLQYANAICGDNFCEGSDSCKTCPNDCGICVEEKYNIIPQYPLNSDTIKRGPLLIQARVLLGSRETTSAIVQAESPIFGTVKLLPSDKEYGLYEGTALINELAEQGQYNIKITAEKKDAKDEQSVKINLNPNLNIQLTPAVYESYSKGERIYLIGIVSDFSGKTQGNATLNVSIYTPIKTILNKTLKLSKDARFDDSYLISFTDPDGTWTVSYAAEDEYGNSGKVDSTTQVSTTSLGLAYYTVEFLSPLNDATYARGSSIPLSVSVLEEGEPVENAEVSFSSPSGEIIYLSEISSGIYSSSYKVKNEDVLGKWDVGVEVLKEGANVTKVGIGNIQVYITGTDFSLGLLPLKDSYSKGMNLKFNVAPSYADGSKVLGAYVEAKLPYKTIVLKETSPGQYTAVYKLSEQDLGSNEIKLSAEDRFGNKGQGTASIFVKNSSFLGYLLIVFFNNIFLDFWAIWLVIFLLLYFLYWPLIAIKLYQKLVAYSKERQSVLKEVRRSLDIKLVKERSITKSEYLQLSKEYSSKITKEEEKQIRYADKIQHLEAKQILTKLFHRIPGNREDLLEMNIKNALSKGFSKKEIMQAALEKGWPYELLNKYLS